MAKGKVSILVRVCTQNTHSLGHGNASSIVGLADNHTLWVTSGTRSKVDGENIIRNRLAVVTRNVSATVFNVRKGIERNTNRICPLFQNITLRVARPLVVFRVVKFVKRDNDFEGGSSCLTERRYGMCAMDAKMIGMLVRLTTYLVASGPRVS